MVKNDAKHIFILEMLLEPNNIGVKYPLHHIALPQLYGVIPGIIRIQWNLLQYYDLACYVIPHFVSCSV